MTFSFQCNRLHWTLSFLHLHPKILFSTLNLLHIYPTSNKQQLYHIIIFFFFDKACWNLILFLYTRCCNRLLSKQSTSTTLLFSLRLSIVHVQLHLYVCSALKNRNTLWHVVTSTIMTRCKYNMMTIMITAQKQGINVCHICVLCVYVFFHRKQSEEHGFMKCSSELSFFLVDVFQASIVSSRHFYDRQTGYMVHTSFVLLLWYIHAYNIHHISIWTFWLPEKWICIHF